MGSRQDKLCQLLKSAGCAIGTQLIPRLQREDFYSCGFNYEIFRVYEQLGGELEDFPIKVGKWDVEIGKVAVELDEECHFNRYRARTLCSQLYSKLPSFPLNAYRGYSISKEAVCLRTASYGGKWTSESCTKQFGPSSGPKDLSGLGSSRWKQRAFYDFLKDLVPIVRDYQVGRISIWDSVFVQDRGLSIDYVLKLPYEEAVKAVPSLIALIEKRAGSTIR